MRVGFLTGIVGSYAEGLLKKLVKNFRIILVTAGKKIPALDYEDVIISSDISKSFHQIATDLSKICDKLYLEKKIKFVHGNSSRDYLIRYAPYISTIHGSFLGQSFAIPIFKKDYIFSFDAMRTYLGLKRWIKYERISCKHAQRIVAVSESVKKEIIQYYGISKEKICVIHNGIDLSKGKNIIKKHNTPKVISYVGRLSPEKGIYEVIKEFTKRKDIDAIFYILGDGFLKSKILQLAAMDKRIICKTFSHSEVINHLSSSDIFVFPTRYEGFSIALLEAMSTGNCCIVYDGVPALKECLGDTGIYVKRSDPVSLVNKIKDIISNHKIIKDYSERAYQRVKKFSIENTVSDYINLYNKVYDEISKVK